MIEERAGSLVISTRKVQDITPFMDFTEFQLRVLYHALGGWEPLTEQVHDEAQHLMREIEKEQDVRDV